MEIILRRIETTLLEVERHSAKPRRWLKFYECIPPVTVCKDVCSMMIGTQYYTGFLARLREYYDCEPMKLFMDESRCSKGYLAMYYPDEKTAYARGPVMKKTVLHEFFHHLVDTKVVFLDDSEKKTVEKLADEYARIFLQRAGETE